MLAMPERAKLSYASSVFQSAWKSKYFSKVITSPKATVPNWKYVEFRHDKIWYTCGIKTLEHINRDGRVCSNLAIKLPNDGFLYVPQESNFHVVETGAETYSSRHNARLAPREIGDPFTSVWDFAD